MTDPLTASHGVSVFRTCEKTRSDHSYVVSGFSRTVIAARLQPSRDIDTEPA